jgi:transposase
MTMRSQRGSVANFHSPAGTRHGPWPPPGLGRWAPEAAPRRLHPGPLGRQQGRNGIRRIWRTGAQWKDLPERYPPSQTGHRRFQAWVRSGVLEQLLQVVAADLRERGALELSECFIDGPFSGANKGGAGWERPSGARVRRSGQVQTVLVFLSPST